VSTFRQYSKACGLPSPDPTFSLPLTGIVVEGRTVAFKVKGGLPGIRTFKGTVSADGSR
jgi:hypothetical protein